jgi:dipicolinate synthase subunit B
MTEKSFNFSGFSDFNLGICMCGSFCTYSVVMEKIRQLSKLGINLYPVMSDVAQTTDTRFGKAETFYTELCDICGRKPITTIAEAEPIGPQKKLDAMIVAPCTGNTLARLANGITDGPVTMACKAHLRNDKPLILAVATNDALGVSLQNIGRLIIRKNIYFVPFGQDDFKNKPMSMVAHFNDIIPTIEMACSGKQLQPIIY